MAAQGNTALELRRTSVFSVYAVGDDGVACTEAPAQFAAASAPAALAAAAVAAAAGAAPMYWVDDQYDKKENVEYEFDELKQFARRRVLAPHDDEEVLSAAALAALQEAQAESTSRRVAAAGAGGMDALFPEDWGMSQFWYTPETCDVICSAIEGEVEAMGGARAGLKIGILSTPSVFLRLKERGAPFFDDCMNFEFDRRFQVFGHQFQYFDFRDADEVMSKYENYFDLLYIDPPFREPKCVGANVAIAQALAKKKGGAGERGGRIIFCTGLMFEQTMADDLGATLRRFCPEHTSKLSNPTRCYTTFPCPALD